MGASEAEVLLKQHLIDPEVCIRCNTCEETCPIDAITHDDRNYVVDPSICNGCNACVPPCPTGSIDHWRTVLKVAPYSVDEQLQWDELPAPVELAAHGSLPDAAETKQQNAATSHSLQAPHSALQPHLHLHDLKNPLTVTVAGNFRLTDADAESDIRHIVLDFGNQIFPLLEGQSVGVIPPGVDASGKPHYLRMYSVASARDGEREGHNNFALTVKRVVSDHDGKPVHGVGSNYLCDLQKGDKVQITGPYGASFLMPNHAGSNLIMICTGTGAAPMRGMTEYRRRLQAKGAGVGGKMLLFFGARRSGELPYFGPLLKLPADLIDVHLAFSRAEDQARAYVQDKLRDAGASVAQLLQSDTYVYICGLKGMETGVMDAFQALCDEAGLNWLQCHEKMVSEGRFHVETY